MTYFSIVLEQIFIFVIYAVTMSVLSALPTMTSVTMLAQIQKSADELKEREKHMKPKIILFDLDGTLLPMDQDVFVKYYFGCLAAKMIPCGYDAKKLVEGIWTGIAGMVQNDGSCTNEEAFWKCFSGIFGDRVFADKPLFEEFYRVEFQQARKVCGFDPLASETVNRLKEMGLRVVLATNPVFPAIATESRIRWAGLEPESFEWYTTYENSYYCKPNPDYYREIMQRLGCAPKDCLMVGNDVEEDMAVETLGMRVFLLTNCLINKEEKDISVYPHGNLEDQMRYIENM